MSSDSVSRAGRRNAWLRACLGHAGRAGSTGQAQASTVLAADADRERAVGELKSAFAEGRLTKDEFDARVTSALTARTHGQLRAAASGLPGWQPSPVPFSGQRRCSASGTARPDPEVVISVGAGWEAPLMLRVLAAVTWFAASAVLHHRWPSNWAVWMVNVTGLCVVMRSMLRYAWRMRDGR